jgi:hypothetical protein
MTSMSDNRSDYTTFIQKGCDSWRKGDDYEGLCSFQMACLLWLDKLGQEESESSVLSPLEYDRIAQMICKLLTYLKQSDITMATDVIEYELLPRLEQGDPRNERSQPDDPCNS